MHTKLCTLKCAHKKSCILNHIFFFINFIKKWWSLSVEVLLSTRPTPSSFYMFKTTQSSKSVKANNQLSIFGYILDRGSWTKAVNKVGPYSLSLAVLSAKLMNNKQNSGSSTLGQILPVIRFAWKAVAEMAENQDLGRGPPNIISSGSLQMVCLSTLDLGMTSANTCF